MTIKAFLLFFYFFLPALTVSVEDSFQTLYSKIILAHSIHLEKLIIVKIKHVVQTDTF